MTLIVTNTATLSDPHISGDFQVYALNQFGNVLFSAGWLSTGVISSTNLDGLGLDRIYVSSSDTLDSFSRITWSTDNSTTGVYGPTDTSTLWTGGTATTTYYQFNDPTVVNQGGTLEMFGTAVPFKYLYPNSSDPDTNQVPNPWHQIGGTFIGLATSTNAGATWTWQGPVSGIADSTMFDGAVNNTGFNVGYNWTGTPTALVVAGTTDLWYVDTFLGQNAPQVIKVALNTSGTATVGSTAAADIVTVSVSGTGALTYNTAPLRLTNPSVAQATDGSNRLWMVGQSGADGTTGDIVAFESSNGIDWTPYDNGSGILVVDPRHGSEDLETPSIVSVGNGAISIDYSLPTEAQNSAGTFESYDPFTPVYDPTTGQPVPAPVTTAFQDQITESFELDGGAANFSAADGTTGQSITAGGSTFYGGTVGVSSPTAQFVYQGPDTESVAALAGSVYITDFGATGAVAASSGSNVLETGSGSFFLTGGTGTSTDTFDIDVHAGSWDTLVNLHPGDEVMFRDLSGVTALQWDSGLGAPGYTGPTMDMTLTDGSHFYATLANITNSAATTYSASPVVDTTGTIAGSEGSAVMILRY